MLIFRRQMHSMNNNNNNNRFTALCPGLSGWAGTRRNTHPPTILIIIHNLYPLLPSTTIHSILLVQITCLAIFLHNLFPHSLWSTSWSRALHLIFYVVLPIYKGKGDPVECRSYRGIKLLEHAVYEVTYFMDASHGATYLWVLCDEVVGVTASQCPVSGCWPSCMFC